MGGFLDYIPGNSLLHRLNPLIKLLLSLLLCVSCFVSHNHFFVIGVIALTFLLGASAGVAARSFQILKALSKLSLLLFVLQVLFIRDGVVYFTLPFGIPITDLGVSFSLLFALRLLAATMPLTLMLSVTQMSDLSNVLVEKVGIPYSYTFALTTAIRFIPVFSAEMSDIMEAQTARGVEFDTKNIFKKIGLLLPLCVPLLISSVKRINSGAMAAELRGFHCRKRGFGYKQYKLTAMDLSSVLLGILLIVLAILL